MSKALALAALILPCAAAAQTVASSPAGEIIMTSQDLAKRLTVPVMVNGQGPFDFVIDTGADRTVISEELAQRLSLPEAGKAKLHAMGGSAQVTVVKIDSIGVSNVIKRDIRAASLPMRYVGADGLLGIDSLKGQRVVMDFPAQTMRVEPSSVPEAAVNTSDLIVVTARTRLGQLVMVDADAAGQKISVVVDTGAQNTVGNGKLRAILSQKVKGTEIKAIDMIDVLGKRTPANYTIVNRVRIGGVAMGNMAVSFADAHPFRLFGLHNKPSMLLGIETLRAFQRVSVDFSTRKIKFLLPSGGGAAAEQ